MAKKKTKVMDKKKTKSKPKELTVVLKDDIDNFCFGKYEFKKGKKIKIPAKIYKQNKSRVKEVKNGK